MIYKSGETIKFVAFFTEGGLAKSGLSVTCVINEIGVGAITPSPTVSEQGTSGLYFCTFTPSNDGCYVCIMHTSTATVDTQDLAAIAFRGIAGVNTVSQFDVTTDIVTTDISGLVDTIIEDVESVQLSVDEVKDDTEQLLEDTSSIQESINALPEPPSTADIWTYPTRTLTSIGDIVEDITNAVWSNDTRTLTSYASLFLRAKAKEIKLRLDMAASEELRLFYGDSIENSYAVLDDRGLPVDITDATVIFTSRETEDSVEALISKECNITHGATGEFSLVITASESLAAWESGESYPADICVIFDADRRKTVWKSNVVCLYSVTH